MKRKRARAVIHLETWRCEILNSLKKEITQNDRRKVKRITLIKGSLRKVRRFFKFFN